MNDTGARIGRALLRAGLRGGRALFRARSWTPVPLAVWIVARARPRREWMVPSLVVATAGLALRLWAVAHIGPESRSRGRGPDHVATRGPYARVKHPLYLANGILSEGLIIAAGAGWPWLQVLFPWLWLAQYGPIMLWEEGTLRARTERATGRRADWRAAWRSERRTRQSVLLFLVAVCVSVLVRAMIRLHRLAGARRR